MSFSQTEATIIQILTTLQQQVSVLTEAVEGLHATVTEMEPAGKEFYPTSELAKVLGSSHFTVTEQYCKQGRIECTKDGNGCDGLRAKSGSFPRRAALPEPQSLRIRKNKGLAKQGPTRRIQIPINGPRGDVLVSRT